MKKNRTWLKNYVQTVSNYLLLIYFFPFIFFFFVSTYFVFILFIYESRSYSAKERDLSFSLVSFHSVNLASFF